MWKNLRNIVFPLLRARSGLFFCIFFSRFESYVSKNHLIALKISTYLKAKKKKKSRLACKHLFELLRRLCFIIILLGCIYFYGRIQISSKKYVLFTMLNFSYRNWFEHILKLKVIILLNIIQFKLLKIKIKVFKK